MNTTLKNTQIYNYANTLAEAFGENAPTLPVKVNFYLMKNQNELITLATEIEQKRLEIIRKYGVTADDGSTYVPEENMQKAQEELNELFNIEQEVKLYKVDIDAFGNVEMTTKQMEAIMFMIEDPEE